MDEAQIPKPDPEFSARSSAAGAEGSRASVGRLGAQAWASRNATARIADFADRIVTLMGFPCFSFVKKIA